MTLPVTRFWRDDSAMADDPLFCRSNGAGPVEFQMTGKA
jgi:hypothetical protein